MVVQEVEFIWKGPGSNVSLSGDFVNWESQLPLEKTGSDGWFVLKQVSCSRSECYKSFLLLLILFSSFHPTVGANPS